MNIILEEARTEDPLLFELYAHTRAEEVGAWGWNTDEQRTFLAMQFRFQQQSYRMQYPNSRIQLIIIDGQRAGKLHTEKSESEWVLVDLVLAPLFRNRGAGTKLIEMLQEEARSAGLPLRLSVRRDNPALRLYARLGFELVHEDELHVQMRWTC